MITGDRRRVIVPQKVLSEDDLAELDYKVHQIKVGMIIKVIYYEKGQCIQMCV